MGSQQLTQGTVTVAKSEIKNMNSNDFFASLGLQVLRSYTAGNPNPFDMFVQAIPLASGWVEEVRMHLPEWHSVRYDGYRISCNPASGFATRSADDPNNISVMLGVECWLWVEYASTDEGSYKAFVGTKAMIPENALTVRCLGICEKDTISDPESQRVFIKQYSRGIYNLEHEKYAHSILGNSSFAYTRDETLGAPHQWVYHKPSAMPFAGMTGIDYFQSDDEDAPFEDQILDSRCLIYIPEGSLFYGDYEVIWDNFETSQSEGLFGHKDNITSSTEPSKWCGKTVYCFMYYDKDGGGIRASLRSLPTPANPSIDTPKKMMDFMLEVGNVCVHYFPVCTFGNVSHGKSKYQDIKCTQHTIGIQHIPAKWNNNAPFALNLDLSMLNGGMLSTSYLSTYIGHGFNGGDKLFEAGVYTKDNTVFFLRIPMTVEAVSVPVTDGTPVTKYNVKTEIDSYGYMSSASIGYISDESKTIDDLVSELSKASAQLLYQEVPVSNTIMDGTSGDTINDGNYYTYKPLFGFGVEGVGEKSTCAKRYVDLTNELTHYVAPYIEEGNNTRVVSYQDYRAGRQTIKLDVYYK